MLWSVEDVVREFAQICDNHIDQVLGKIERNNWRVAKDILAGFRVAVFRSSVSAMPTLLTGTIVETPAHIVPAASSLRVLFDDSTTFKAPRASLTSYSSSIGNGKIMDERLFDKENSPIESPHNLNWTDFSMHLGANADHINVSIDQPMPNVVGAVTLDIREPIW